MRQKYLLFLIAVCCLSYFTACTSESYKIDDANSTDTSSTKDPTTFNQEEVNKILKSKKTYTVKTAPTFILSISGQYNIGVSEVSLIDNPSQLFQGQNFGVRNGFGISAMGKFPIDKQKGNLRIVVHGVYNHFSANFKDIASANGEIKYNIISGGVGIENSFTPKFSVKPFVGAALLGSLISGSSSFDTSGVPFDITIKNSFRLGFTLYAGVEYALSNNIGLNLGAKFTNVNTWLKKTKDDGSNSEFALRDAFSSQVLPYGGWKNFAFTSFYIGTSIYFGVKDKLFKF
jgi:opacity protein-like surface antigen